MPSLIKVQTCDLAGKALLWSVELVGGQAIDDATGEYLIQKHGMWIDRGYSWPWLACVSGHPLDRQPGDTRAEAAARAVVHHARGETINVPKELMP